MNDAPSTVLYVKRFCLWCWLAEWKLRQLGIEYRTIDVSRDARAFDEMKRISGQTYAPTLVVGEQVLANFGPTDLAPFLRRVGLVGREVGR